MSRWPGSWECNVHACTRTNSMQHAPARCSRATPRPLQRSVGSVGGSGRAWWTAAGSAPWPQRPLAPVGRRGPRCARAPVLVLAPKVSSFCLSNDHTCSTNANRHAAAQGRYRPPIRVATPGVRCIMHGACALLNLNRLDQVVIRLLWPPWNHPIKILPVTKHLLLTRV